MNVNGSFPAQAQEFGMIISLVFGMALPVIVLLYVLSCIRRMVNSLEDLADYLERIPKRTAEK